MKKDNGLLRIFLSSTFGFLSVFSTFAAAVKFVYVWQARGEAEGDLAVLVAIGFLAAVVCVTVLIYSVLYWLRSADKEKEARYESWKAEMRKRTEKAKEAEAG